MVVGTLGDPGSVTSFNQVLGEVGGETSHNYPPKMARDDAVLQLSVKLCIRLHPSRQQLVYFSCVCPIIQQQAATCGSGGQESGPDVTSTPPMSAGLAKLLMCCSLRILEQLIKSCCQHS